MCNLGFVRLFVLFELERLWSILPHVYDLISNQVSTNDPQHMKLLRSRSVINSLDKGNYALCDIALKLLTSDLDKLLEKLPASSPIPRGNAAARTKRKDDSTTAVPAAQTPRSNININSDREKVSLGFVVLE